MRSRRELAITLSKLKDFLRPDARLEQYTTDSDVAADVLWHAYLKGDIADKTIADFGCGTGILGIGALLLGARYVFFVDKDKEAIRICTENLELLEYEVGDHSCILEDISKFDSKVDAVFQNPPFGTKQAHADRTFLLKAFACAPKVYSFHKTSTRSFVQTIARDHQFVIAEEMNFNYPLKKTYSFQTKKRETIEVTCYYLRTA